MKRIMYVTFEEAEKLKPFFRYSKVHGPYKEARESSSRILEGLENVRPINYSPLRGYQMFLDEDDHEFFMDVLGMVGKE